MWSEDQPLGLQTDIYAFGIVIWEVLSRQRAWKWIHGPAGQWAISFKVCGVSKAQPVRPMVPDGLSADCRWLIRYGARSLATVASPTCWPQMPSFSGCSQMRLMLMLLVGFVQDVFASRAKDAAVRARN